MAEKGRRHAESEQLESAGYKYNPPTHHHYMPSTTTLINYQYVHELRVIIDIRRRHPEKETRGTRRRRRGRKRKKKK